MRFLSVLVAVALAATPGLAKKKAKAAAEAPATKAAAPNAKALADMAGKFKWGAAPDEVYKVLTEQLKEKYAEKIKAEVDVYRQDQLRKEMNEEIAKVKASHVKFDGQKTGWDVSIIDKEFRHKNNESMAVLWEKDQRRFLFFYHDKLYKQFIAFNAEHPSFQGKTFDDFSKLIERRFGPGEMKFSSMRTKQDEMIVDHLEWPAQGDTILWAIDQSQFYGNFCLVLKQASVVAQLEKDRGGAKNTGNALIDSVTTRDKIEGDKNENVVDDITKKSK